jgi:hypothetical protein
MICFEGQGFGENANPSYKTASLVGHTGQDWGCGWHTPIHSPYDGVVYKVLTPENPSNDGSGFTGVFLLVDDGFECFEWLAGHCDPTVQVGQQVKKGDLIGYEANHGTVYAGNMRITLSMQQSGDQRGHHRHYQKRPVRPVKTVPKYGLSAANDDGSGSYRDAKGNYYEVFDYLNGFHGCVDPTLPIFNRLLTVGMSGYDVFVMQRILKKYFLFDSECTGFFGPITMTALMYYQTSKSLAMVGFAGPSTRAALSQELLSLPDLGTP